MYVIECEGYILGEISGQPMFAENGEPLLTEGGSCQLKELGTKMAILNIQLGQAGLEGIKPRWDYILTDDPKAIVLSPGYLNKSVEQGFSFNQGDIVSIATKEFPTSKLASGLYQIDHNGDNWNLIALSSSSSSSSTIVLNTQTFTSGSGTYIPTSGTQFIVVEMCGGGGGSGGAYATAGTIIASGPGIAGNYMKFSMSASELIGGISYTVGAAGTAGVGSTTPTAGGAGGDTHFGDWICGGGAASQGSTLPGARPSGFNNGNTVGTGNTILAFITPNAYSNTFVLSSLLIGYAAFPSCNLLGSPTAHAFAPGYMCADLTGTGNGIFATDSLTFPALGYGYGAQGSGVYVQATGTPLFANGFAGKAGAIIVTEYVTQ